MDDLGGFFPLFLGSTPISMENFLVPSLRPYWNQKQPLSIPGWGYPPATNSEIIYNLFIFRARAPYKKKKPSLSTSTVSETRGFFPKFQASYFLLPLLQTCKCLGWPWKLRCWGRICRLWKKPFTVYNSDHQDYYSFSRESLLYIYRYIHIYIYIYIPFTFPYPNHTFPLPFCSFRGSHHFSLQKNSLWF